MISWKFFANHSLFPLNTMNDCSTLGPFTKVERLKPFFKSFLNFDQHHAAAASKYSGHPPEITGCLHLYAKMEISCLLFASGSWQMLYFKNK